MKKLISLSSIFTFLGLLLAGCQSSDNITSPVNDLEKPKPIEWGTAPAAVNIPEPGAGLLTQIDLVAGQSEVVGYVEVEKVGTNLEITYFTNNGWNIIETHLQVVANPNQFFVNSAGNPQIGLFPYGHSDVNDTKSPTYVVPIPEGLTDGMVYIGAHAVVEFCEGQDDASICPPGLAESGEIVFLDKGIPDYYIKMEFADAVLDAQKEFFGWCVDDNRGIKLGPTLETYGAYLSVNLLCSTDEPIATCIVDYPENLPKANWIINNREGYTMEAIQAALWTLLTKSTKWQNNAAFFGTNFQELVDAANDFEEENGEFVPGCGDKILVLVYQTGESEDFCDDIDVQVIAFEVEVPCYECYDETAWAFNFPVDNTSQLFPGHVWFRYFGYKVQ